MVDIPTYKPDSVRARPVDATPLRGASPDSFGQDVAQATQRMGGALDRAAEVGTQLMDQQAETRATEVDVALSAHIRESLLGEEGLMRKQGQAFVDSAPTYLKSIEDKAQELRKGRNAFEQRMLDKVVNQRLDAARTQIGGQVIKEQEFANKAAKAARVINQTTNTAMSYRDPEAYSRERAALLASVADNVEAQGATDPATLQAATRERMNDVHVYAVQDMVRRGEVAQAQSWLDTALIKGELSPASATALQEKVEKAVEETELGYLVDGRAPPSVVDGKLTTASPELVAAVGFQESRGNGAAVSPKGAQGSMQVMPDTGPEAARLAGVPWQPERMVSRKPEDVEYQTKLGTAYLNAQLSRFGGNVAVALAAYNAGPARAEQWVKSYGVPGEGQTVAQWINKLPFAETRDYITKITARLGGTTRAPLSPNVRTVEEVDAFAQQFTDPKQRAAARAAGLTRVNMNRASEYQRQSDAWDAVQPYLQKDTPWSSIPKAIWNNLDPQHQTSIIDAQKAGGTSRRTDPVVLDKVYDMMETAPDDFKDMDLLTLAPQLSGSDFEELRKLQRDARMGMGNWKRPAVQYATINRLVATVAPPTLLKPANKAELAVFKSRWYQALVAKQAGQTDPLTEDEIAEVGTRLTAETAFGPKLLGGADTRPLYKFAVTDGKADGLQYVPPAERSEVVKFLQQRTPSRAPTNAEVLDTWRNLKALGAL